MAESPGFSAEQFSDRFLTRSAYAMLLVAVGYSAEAAEPYVSEPVVQVLDYVSMATSAAIFILLLPLFATYLKHCRGKGSDFEGFVSEIFKKACIRAFEVTFIFLLILDVLSRSVLEHIPAKTFLQVAVAVCVASMGLTFWVLNRQARGDGIDEDDFDEGLD